MLAIGRALLARPRLLMIDEFSFGLSPLLTAEMLSYAVLGTGSTTTASALSGDSPVKNYAGVGIIVLRD